MSISQKLLVEKMLKYGENHIIAQIGSKVRRISKNNEKYPYIQSTCFDVFTMIEDLNKLGLNFSESSFIDAGCGVPVIPDIMRILGFKDTVGLEYNETYCSIEPSLLQGDMLKFNFKPYDVIYSYNPFMNHELMNKAIRNVMKTMKKGAIFYFNQACSLDKDISEKLTLLNNSRVLRFQK